jgi:hypothetical protein
MKNFALRRSRLPVSFNVSTPYASIARKTAACDPQIETLIEEVLGRGHIEIFDRST